VCNAEQHRGTDIEGAAATATSCGMNVRGSKKRTMHLMLRGWSGQDMDEDRKAIVKSGFLVKAAE